MKHKDRTERCINFYTDLKDVRVQLVARHGKLGATTSAACENAPSTDAHDRQELVSETDSCDLWVCRVHSTHFDSWDKCTVALTSNCCRTWLVGGSSPFHQVAGNSSEKYMKKPESVLWKLMTITSIYKYEKMLLGKWCVYYILLTYYKCDLCLEYISLVSVTE